MSCSRSATLLTCSAKILRAARRLEVSALGVEAGDLVGGRGSRVTDQHSVPPCVPHQLQIQSHMLPKCKCTHVAHSGAGSGGTPSKSLGQGLLVHQLFMFDLYAPDRGVS